MNIIRDQGNMIFFSQLSLYEIAIKQSIGKLPHFKSDIDEVYHQAVKDNFSFLPVQNHHLYSYKKIPFFSQHRDPFDRLLIATAYEENAVMLTADKNFSLYRDFIKIVW
jgi:PIN domain nuclease of toxin-antitoxin system